MCCKAMMVTGGSYIFRAVVNGVVSAYLRSRQFGNSVSNALRDASDNQRGFSLPGPNGA